MKLQNSQRRWVQNNKGQIFVEYILLMLIAIATATLINKALTMDNEDINEAGVLRKQWFFILKAIAEDKQN